MSHELTTNSITNQVEFAYRESDGMPWHGLGQALPDGATIDQWRVAAGMDWRIKRAKVRYPISPETVEMAQFYHEMPDQHVLFRSDNCKPLGIVSDKYKVVQPSEVIEFFRDIVKVGGLELSAAGTIYGGKRYWATAKIGEAAPVSVKDKIGGYLLISTSADGSTATEVRRTTVRVVCRNTLAMASREQASLRISHRTEFDPESVKWYMNINEAAWEAFRHQMTRLAEKQLDMDQAEELAVSIIGGEKNKVRTSSGFNNVMRLFTGAGAGSTFDGVYGSAFGLLNAFTEHVDHHARTRSEENRFVSSQWGPGAELKQRAFDVLAAV
jgi:phage/plasmid-like protein (TIGR03299 family)